MDRQIVYPGSIPLDTDILSLQRDAMIAIGYLAQATLGTGMVADGLACAPTVPASMQVTVGPGSLAQMSVIDGTAFGSLAADTTDPLVKIGINTTPTTFTLSAPTSSGYSVNYLIEATLSEADATPVVLPYYNAANPSQPYSGANNSGVAQNTQRLQRVALQLKPGVPAPAGAQTTPAVDPGWAGLYTITVANAQTQINAGAIVTIPTAPFIPFKLPTLAPGFSRVQVLTSSTNFVVPVGVRLLKVRLVGGGAGGSGGNANTGGGGGGAGGYSEGIFAVTPGTVYAVTIGAGSGGVGVNATAGSGGTTSLGALISATGGSGGASVNPNCNGGQGGQGYGGAIALAGGWGTDGYNTGSTFAGVGGASAFGGGGRAGSGGGQAGAAPGSGGGGCYGTPGVGGNGANGMVIVEYLSRADLRAHSGRRHRRAVRHRSRHPLAVSSRPALGEGDRRDRRRARLAPRRQRLQPAQWSDARLRDVGWTGPPANPRRTDEPSLKRGRHACRLRPSISGSLPVRACCR